MATKKSTRGRARRAASPGEYENPNTPVAPFNENDPAHVPFAEREEVTVNPNTPVAPETPDDRNAIPFADRDPRDPTGAARTGDGDAGEDE